LVNGTNAQPVSAPAVPAAEPTATESTAPRPTPTESDGGAFGAAAPGPFEHRTIAKAKTAKRNFFIYFVNLSRITPCRAIVAR